MRLALLLVCVYIPMASAQPGYQDGFLLSQDLDTIRGSIRFQSKESVPMPCLFRADRKSEPREVYPGTVHGFCTSNGAYFFSRSIGNSEDVFLEVLVKGYMNLFKFGDIYYVEKGDSVFFELSDDWEVAMADGTKQPQKSKNFARMLSLLMIDCPETSQKSTDTPLRDKALVRLIAAYNRCRGSDSHFFRVKAKAR